LMIGGNWLTESLSGVVSATMSRRSKASNGSAPWGRAQRWVGGLWLYHNKKSPAGWRTAGMTSLLCMIGVESQWL